MYRVALFSMLLIAGCNSGVGTQVDSSAGNPVPQDSDGDGFSNEIEQNGRPATDPFDATDNPNSVRDSDGDGCSDYEERSSRFCDGDPNTPPFDGFWQAAGILDQGQDAVGETAILIEVSAGRAACVAEGKRPDCPLEWKQTRSVSRPVTLSGGIIRIDFSMNFQACVYDAVDPFDGEKLIDVSITGFEIAGTDGFVFDVAIEQRFIFSDTTLYSTGTLEYFPNAAVDTCN